MIIGSTHNGYIAPKGWKPKNPDENYILGYFDIEMGKGKTFEDVVETFAAVTSTGEIGDAVSKKRSGTRIANKLKAAAFDLDPKDKTFKVAYKKEIFEKGNMSGILSTILGSVDGIEDITAFRCLDIRFPREVLQSFPGPQFGIEGMREQLHIDEGPLLCSAPGPKLGCTAEEQAKLAEVILTASSGEFNGFKDNDGLTSSYFNSFDERCELIHKRIQDIERKSGKRKYYICNITHSDLDVMIDRADKIKAHGGRWLMIDLPATGLTALETMRLKNPGLAIHASQSMSNLLSGDKSFKVYDGGRISDFSISIAVISKIFRILGADSIGGIIIGSENYGESKLVRDTLQLDVTPESSITLGQNWFGMKPSWYLTEGNLNPGDILNLVHKLGEDIIIEVKDELLEHPWGIEAGVEAVIQARDIALGRGEVEQWILEHPDSALAKASHHWKFSPKTV
jgi:ribulose-bisphosphate carboxylase large chain